jgi:hypothetical protein
MVKMGNKTQTSGLVDRSCSSVVKWHQQNQAQQRASSAQKFSTRIGYNVFLVAVGLMTTAPILTEICYTTHVISEKDVKMCDD